jgi:hypothetical protein
MNEFHRDMLRIRCIRTSAKGQQTAAAQEVPALMPVNRQGKLKALALDFPAKNEFVSSG